MTAPQYDVRLANPGLVENSEDSEHCVQAAMQMIMRMKRGAPVPSFDELDLVLLKVPGKYTWEYNLLAALPGRGFRVRTIWPWSAEAALTNLPAFFDSVYGQEIGKIFSDNTDAETFKQSIRALISSDVTIEQRIPQRSDIFALLSEGFFLTLTINQRILQADPGFVAHSIVIFGAGPRGVRIHNPGPPATADSELAWDLFERAWSETGPEGRILIAIKPIQD